MRRTPITVYDTVSIQVQPARPPKRLEKAQPWHDQRRGITWQQGYVQNFRVRYFKPDRLLQASGSLPKLLLRNNVENLDLAGVVDSVQMLGETIGFHPHTARVFRLDLAATMKMPRPPSQYLTLLGARSRYKQIIHVGESVTYHNQSLSELFYDKGNEAGIHGNLLRFEVQYKQRLLRQFGWHVVLSDLCEEKRYEQFVRCWEEKYYSVPKVKRPVLHCPRGVRDLMNQLAQIGLAASGGSSALEPVVDGCDCAAGLSSRLRKRARTLETQGNHLEDSLLIGELDRAVEQAVTRALSAISV